MPQVIFTQTALQYLARQSDFLHTNKPLSVAIIGGMISSTLLTLVVVPAAYSLVMSGLQRFKH